MAARDEFSGFGHYGAAEDVSRHWLAALFASSAVYVLIAVLAVAIGTATRELIAPPEPVKITFVEKVVRAEPPPLPVVEPPRIIPPKMQAKPQAPAPAAAAAVPKNMKIRKLDKPPPPKELVAPDKMPLAPPKEADPSLDKGVAVYGEPGSGDPAGLEGGLGGLGHGLGYGLPAGAVPPRPFRSNRRPPYPPTAVKKQVVGTVVIQCVIRADGKVEGIEVVRGDEPFSSVAARAVKGWHYEPAVHEGQRISVPHVIEIRFKLPA